MRRRLAVLPAAISALLLLTSPVAALGTLDQEQAANADTNYLEVTNAVSRAQVFTAGLTGLLDHVDLLLFESVEVFGPADAVTVEIWTVSGGMPASAIPGASAIVLQADVPDIVNTWVQVPITAPSVAGTQYAIVLSSASTWQGCSFDNDCWIWRADDSGPYAGGGSFFSVFGSNWTAQASDHAFRTYVTVPAASVAASLADAATALPTSAPPLATLGFGVLLISSLGVLLVANVRARSR
jgi:hypothetical protein